MDLLKSYWRMDYIRSTADDGPKMENPFVEIPLWGDDRKALIIHRGKHNYIVLNRFPYNAGHLLVVPFEAKPDLEDLSPEARYELLDLIILAKSLLQKTMNPDGFNVGFNLGKSAGAGIPQHLHAHIVPRWNGDTNFLPVIGETRTLPQALDQTWEILTQANHAR